jgi:hyperosmotically inducible protein
MKTILKVATVAAVGSLICSCVPVLIGGGAAGGYYIAKDKHSVGNYTDDAVITSKVKAKYLKDLVLKSFGISVSTNHGVVSLVGSVSNEETRQRAINIAMNTGGVKAVDAHNLTVNIYLK